MKLSIIIVSFNTKKLTIKAIRSVFADNSVKRKEVIVVDNASSDGSVEAIKRHPEFSSGSKNLKLVQNDKNLGFSRANNQGIRIAKGKYIFLLNSDTKVKKGALGKLIDFAKSKEDVGVVGARLLNFDGSAQKSCFNFPTIGRAVNQYWRGKSRELEKFAPKGTEFCEVDAVVGAAMLLTPKALEKVGDLDERYFFFYEDLAYCREIYHNGLKVYYLPTAEIVHYHGASGKSLKKSDDQWRRLIPSSKTYHGILKHCIFNFVLWSGQKWQKIRKN